MIFVPLKIFGQDTIAPKRLGGAGSDISLRFGLGTHIGEPAGSEGRGGNERRGGS